MSGVDKAHEGKQKQYMSECWNELGVLEKAELVVTGFLAAVFMMLPGALLRLTGMQEPPIVAVKRVNDRIYLVEYAMPLNHSNCVVVIGDDGTLLLRSPPPLTTESLIAISALGRPKVLVASFAHDTFVDVWKEKFPDALVMASENDVKIINDRAKVDVTVEESADLLMKYRISQSVSTGSFTRYEDVLFIVDIPGRDGKKACLMPCGFVNHKYSLFDTSTWVQFITGFSGFRMPRFFSFVFCKDAIEADAVWKRIVAIPGVSLLVFLHGEPVEGNDLPARVEKAKVATSRRLINI